MHSLPSSSQGLYDLFNRPAGAALFATPFASSSHSNLTKLASIRTRGVCDPAHILFRLPLVDYAWRLEVIGDLEGVREVAYVV